MLSTTMWSRDIFWINDGGDFMDAQHWSLSSGGEASDIIPSEGDRLFFDQKSFSDTNQEVVLKDSVKVKSINTLFANAFQFIGTDSSVLEIMDILKFSPEQKGKFEGFLRINSSNAKSVGLNTFGNIHFKKSIAVNIESESDLLLSKSFLGHGLLITSVTINETNSISCNGGSDGELTATVLGGSGDYSYAWQRASDVFPDSDVISGLDNGFYVLTVTDNVTLLEGVALYDLREPAPIIISIPDAAVTDVSCNGFCDGEINVSVTGFNLPLGYLWSNGETTEDITGLCAASYTLTVTDNNGCTNQATKDVSEPTSITIDSFSDTDVDCNGNSTGTVTVAASGGTGTITYTWNDLGAQTGTGASHTATGLPAGTYTCTVTDDNACSITQDVTIGEPIALSATASGTNITCNGDGNGTATVSTVGGTTPYTYLWNDVGASISGSISSLNQATYTITVTDDNGCTSSDSYTVTEPAVLSVVTAKTDLLCFEICSGDATATPAGGTSPYSYSWDDPGTQTGTGVTHTATGLCSGLVNVTVTDDNGCTVGGSETLTEPTEVIVSIDAITNVTCNSGADGDITSSVAGGSLPYASNIWDDPLTQNTLTPSGLSAGTFTMTVTDNNGCTATGDTTLVEPDAITGVITVNGASCNGVCDGDLSVVASGGSGVYTTYAWDDPGAQSTAATASTLCAGTFIVTITDDQGCTGTATEDVTEPVPLAVTATGSNATCKSLDNGSITTVVVGGTGPYDYLWDDLGASTSSGISSLSPGTYTVVVTDDNGCTANDNSVITEPDTLAYSFDAITNTTCNGDSDGDISGTTAGGTAPYTYAWTNGATAIEDPTGLSANTYTLTLTDDNGCIITGDTTITEPDPITITLDLITDATCNGGANGSVDVTIAGGTGPYTYLWDDAGASTSQDLSGVIAGTYTLTVTDNNLCVQASIAYVVGEADAITGVVTTVDASCNGVCDGEVLITPSGGTLPYASHVWDDAGTTDAVSMNGLCAATYTVTVTDANGCTGSASGVVDQPAANTVTVTSTPTQCAGVCDGTATATPSGGTAPYSYLWDDPGAQSGSGTATHTATALCVGLVNVTITDALGCVSNGNTTVTAPSVVTASISNSTNVTCNGGTDGFAALSGSGGIAPYTYDWSPISVANDTITILTAGTHNGIVIDQSGCRDSVEFTLTEPDPIVITTTTIDPLCNGVATGLAAVTNVTGGTGGYTYLWDDVGATANDSLINVEDGSYTVTVTDAVFCTNTATVTLTDPTALSSITFSSDPTCYQACDGRGTVTPVGGVAPYTYVWDHDVLETDSIAENLCDTLGFGTPYDGTVYDANLCPLPFQVTITDDPEITISTVSTDPTCSYSCNGQATVTYAGGISGGPFTVSWDDSGSQTTDTALSLCDTTYVASVTETATGCVVRDTVILTVADAVIFGSVVTDASCFVNCDGAIDMTLTNGTLPYTSTTWDNGETTEDISSLCVGSYVLTVLDGNNCNYDTTIVVASPSQITGTIATDSTSCFGDSDGQMTVTESGGDGGPYSVVWDDPLAQTSTTASSLVAGTYTVTITDGSGCTGTVTDSIGQADSLQANIGADAILCFGDCNGITYSSPSGGIAPYTYLWDDIAATTTDSLQSLCAGTYALQVTDSEGCTRADTAVVIEPSQLTASITDTVHVICACSGEALVTASGGTGLTYTYLWDDLLGQTTARATGLCAGNYTVTVTDSNNCSVIVPVTITTVTDFAVSITTVNNVSCSGACDGSMIALATGGLAPYTYLWDDPLAQTNDTTASNLCEGEFTVTVTDANGCSVIATDSVDTPNPITGVFTSTMPSCNGYSDGQVIVTPSGGNSGYTYLWDDLLAQTDSTATGLVAGNYNVTIIDDSACFVVLPVSLSEPAILLANTDSVDVTCFGACDGIALSTPIGGTSPYTYLWDDALATTTDSVLNNCPDTLAVLVTDANACISRDTTIIIEPSLLTSSITDTVHVICTCIGEALVTPVGGTAPYTYLWNDIAAQTDARALNLCAGAYSVTVTDANGCTSISTVTIDDQSDFNATITDTTHNLCFGDCFGEAIATPTGGTLPYTYSWTSSIDTDSTSSSLCAGSYFATVSDAAGCTRNLPFTITEPAVLSATFNELTSIDCNGNCIGELQVVVAGGTAPYTYLWDDGGAQSTDTASGLCAGSYNVTVTDDNGCVGVFAVTLSQPAALTALIVSYNDITCNGDNDGQIVAGFGGGTAPVTYSWSPIVSTNDTISLLAPNTYTVTVTDANLCTDNTSQLISEPLLLTSSITDTTHNICFGACVGDAIVTPVGGTSPYTYSWDDPASTTDSSASSLCAGAFVATVADNNGCTVTSNVTITEPADIVITLDASTNASCMSCDGTADISVVGGTGVITYLWDANSLGAQSTTVSATDLCASTYEVIVTDDNACQDSLDVVITGPNALSATISSFTDVSCYGLNDGTVDGTATGGTAPYTYAWDDGLSQTTEDADSLSQGTYTYTITDGAGCSAFNTVTITEPDTLIATITSTLPSLCNLPGTGEAVVGVTGGTSPYTYLWTDALAQTTATANALIASNYTVTVTDSRSCTDTAIAVVTGPNALTVSLAAMSNTSCLGSSDGSITVVASGGTGVGTYTYLWDDALAQTGVTANNLLAGTYTCTVTDGNGCTVQYVGVITGPSAISISLFSTTNSSCLGCDGSATIVASGGTGNLSYLWEANNLGVQATDSVANDLCASDHWVYVTDDNGCQDSLEIYVPGPANYAIDIDALNDVSCNGLCDGSIETTVVNGNLPYTYLWDDPTGQTTDDATLLCDGIYTLTVIDNIGCIATNTVTLSEPDVLQVLITDSTASGCNLPGTGTATATVTGGTSAYTYSWSDPLTQSTAVAGGLTPGNYTVSVADANGCTDSDDVSIVGPNALTLALVSMNNISCDGLCDGSMEVVASGGTPPYTYLWDDVNTSLTTSINGLCAGTYTCTVTDDNGCTVQYVGVITGPSAISISLFSTSNSSCLGCDGSATIVAIGGTGNLSYLWEANNLGVQATDSVANDLCASDHWVYVTDDNGCQDSLEIYVPGPANYAIDIDALNDVSCNGLCDGSIETTVVNGNLPYTYLWDDPTGQTTDDATLLCDGIYTLTVIDNIGCIATNTVTLSEPDVLQVLITDSTASGCNLPGTGTATATVTGGTSAYTYSWSDPLTQSTAVAGGLTPGNYTVSVADANGCTDSDDVSIVGPNALTLALVSLNNISCNGLCDGSMEIVASGGTPPYTYLWDDPNASTTPSISGLCTAGTFTCTVIDDNGAGCAVTYTNTIIEPSVLTGSFTDTTMVMCNADCDGIIGFTPTGGTSPYTYSWNSGQTDSLITSLCAGTYDLSYSDASGCSNTASMVITEPVSALTSSISAITQISCSANCEGDATVSASGGTAPYTYLWDVNDNGYAQNTTFADTLCAQPYDVLVTDANGCTSSSTASVNTALALAISMGESDITCNGACDGTASVGISGGISPFDILWSNGSTATSLSSLCPGTYIVTVSDAGGCTLVDSVIITEPDVLAASISSSQDALCSGDCNGEATVEVTGGTRPYSYAWDGGQTDSLAVGLCGRSYDVVVNDANGCPAVTATANINEPSSIIIIFSTITEPSCNGGSDGAISIIPSGGTNVYPVVDWAPSGDIGMSISGVSAGDHTVTINDDNGCELIETFTVGQPDELFAEVTDTTHILCMGICNGDAIVGGSGGTGPYSIVWDSGQNGAVRTNLCPGDYGFTVTDDNGCVATSTATINTESALQATINETNVSCSGLCDASMEVLPTGGNSPYTVSWSSGESVELIGNLCPTTRLVDVTDANGCNITLSGQVSEPVVLSATITDSTNISCFNACDGTATVTPSGGTAPYSFLWDANSLGIQQTAYRSTFLCAGNIDVVVTDANGCFTSAEVNLTEPTEILASHSVQPASCNNVSDGAADFSITGGAGGYTFSWSGPDGFVSSQEDINALQDGSYTIQAMDANGCEVEAVVDIVAQTIVNAYAGDDVSVCKGDSVRLYGVGGDVISWSTGETADSIFVEPLVPTEYILTVTSAGCIDQDTISVSVNPQPVANAGEDDVIVSGGSTMLEALGGTMNSTYAWYPSVGLSDTTSANPVAKPEETTMYQLIIQDGLGCVDTDYVEVIVVPSVVIPTGITPNGDGKNDTWQLEYITQFPNPVVEIYNRWGQLVYRSEGYLENWDGTDGDKDLPVGTYYYIIDLGEGVEPITGPLTLMR